MKAALLPALLALLAGPPEGAPAPKPAKPCPARKARMLKPSSTTMYPQLFPRTDDGFDAFWLRVIDPKQEGEKTRFLAVGAQVSSTGKMLSGAREISEPNLKSIARGGGGFAGTTSVFHESGSRWLTTVARCLPGARCQPRAELPPSPVGHGSAALAWSPKRGEFALLYEEKHGGHGNSKSRLVFVRLDESARLVEGSRRVISEPEHGSSVLSEYGHALVPVAGGWVTAFGEADHRGQRVFVAELGPDGEVRSRRPMAEGRFLHRASLAVDDERTVVVYRKGGRVEVARLHAGGRVEGPVPVGEPDRGSSEPLVAAGNNGFVLAWYDDKQGLSWAFLPNDKPLPELVEGGALATKAAHPWALGSDRCGAFVTDTESRVHFLPR